MRDKNQRNSKEHDHAAENALPSSYVPLMIPVVEREDISVMEFDVVTMDGAELDIEAGQLSMVRSIDRVGSSTSKRNRAEQDKTHSISDRTKIFLDHSKTKVLAVYDSLLPILERKRKEFQEKPRSEQIIISAIGSLSFLFIILLLILVAQ